MRKAALENPVLDPDLVNHVSRSVGAPATESEDTTALVQGVVPITDIEASGAPANTGLVEMLDSIKLGVDEGAEVVTSAKGDSVPRMIVEAMVIRELDLDEAFLDFTRI